MTYVSNGRLTVVTCRTSTRHSSWMTSQREQSGKLMKRRVLLDWACLPRTASTASASQVREREGIILLRSRFYAIRNKREQRVMQMSVD